MMDLLQGNGANYSNTTASTATRSSSGSGSGDRRRADPSAQASQIEKSVTHLLVATKQLLETLTQWSRGNASESDVSDVYVRLGYEFNIACRSFNGVGIDVSDLGPVPDILRTILEETLSQDASQQSLDRFLPRIRDIIINLLHGLKRKQQKLRQRTGRDTQRPSDASGGDRTERLELADGSALPPRTSSVTSGRASPTRRASEVPNGADVRRQGSSGYQSGQTLQYPSSSSDPALLQPTAGTNDPPAVPPPPYIENSSVLQRSQQNPSLPPLPPPPPIPEQQQPIPRQQDALSALQRGGDLERRASRRFSAYQISKHLGVGVQAPMPPPQNSPIPNRGREVRESLQAVRMRSGNNLHSRGSSRQNTATADASPNRQASVRETNKKDRLSPARPTLELPQDRVIPSSPESKTPPDKYGNSYIDLIHDRSASGSRLSGPQDLDVAPVLPPTPIDQSTTTPEPTKLPQGSADTTDSGAETSTAQPLATSAAAETDVDRPLSSDPLTIFLQYKTKVKKFILATGYKELSTARLQLAFIEKFSWNTHNNGTDLPDIYIQDSVSGIRHELEDLNDVKNNSVLVLNVDDMDEMKRHFDDGFGGLRRIVEDMSTVLTNQQTALQKVSERQQDAAKEIAKFASAPPPTPVASTPKFNGVVSRQKAMPSQLGEVQNLRRELAVMRQSYSNHIQNMESSMTELRSKAMSIKNAAAGNALSVSAAPGRAHVNASKKSLTNESEKIINRVDDIQDVIEELRKDVVLRGVRPLPKQLDKVNRDIAGATADLKKFRDTMKREKTVWGKVHEEELQVVCDDQEVLRVQEDFAADLEDDLDKAAQTFTLVEQATKQQMATANGPMRTPSRTIGSGADVDPLKAKDNVLGEVRALQPNHEGRLEAIERAERLRQEELATRLDGAFKRELGSFVEGQKLKRTGGVDEVERLRIVRDDAARKENWERAVARAAELEAEEAAAEAEEDEEGENEEAEEEEGQYADDDYDDEGAMRSPEPEFVVAPESHQHGAA